MSEIHTLKSEILPDDITNGIKLLQEGYRMGSSNGKIPQLPAPWSAISIGNDELKLLARAQFEKCGIFVKRYYNPKYASIVYDSYKAISPFVKATSFPIQMPISMQGDALIFQDIETQDAHNVYTSETGFYQLLHDYQSINRPISSPLPFATELLMLQDVNGAIHYADPFLDGINTLMDKA